MTMALLCHPPGLGPGSDISKCIGIRRFFVLKFSNTYTDFFWMSVLLAPALLICTRASLLNGITDQCSALPRCP